MSMSNGFFEKLIAGKWIAGPNINDAIKRSMQLNKSNEHAIINFLGEEYTDKANVSETVAEYMRLISAIQRSGVSADISLKPTQLGLRIGYAYAANNYAKIVNEARAKGIFTWLDMESSSTTDSTIKMYKSVLDSKSNVGICLQSYLKRTLSDMRSLVNRHAVIRLVKGAYREYGKRAFQSRQEVNNNYVLLMRYLFKNSSTFTIATHDDTIIAEARELNKSYQRHVTYAFLNGIRTKLARGMAMQG
ncbi:MAG: proline dehydrogenase family protein, partial [Candidatus Micrarchaeaceae archaeon]